MEENKLIDFLSKHWFKILLGVLAVATITMWSERLLHSNQKENKQDFFLAQQFFERFQKGEYFPSESIETMENILARHPELHPKYDSLMALTFFAQHNVAEATHYARSLIEHAAPQLPSLYQEYAQTTLLISEGKYPEAYSAATSLAEKLNAEPSFKTLGAMNTLRLLLLADHLGNHEEQRAFWQKLKKHPGYPAIESLFQEGTLSLADYARRH